MCLKLIFLKKKIFEKNLFFETLVSQYFWLTCIPTYTLMRREKTGMKIHSHAIEWEHIVYHFSSVLKLDW